MDYLKIKALSTYLKVDFTHIKQYSYYLFRYEYCFFAVLNLNEYKNSDFKDSIYDGKVSIAKKEFFIYRFKHLTWNKEKDQIQLIM